MAESAPPLSPSGSGEQRQQKRLIIVALAGYSVVALAAIVMLQVRGVTPHDSLVTTLSVAIGAIAALAAK